jgi:hypothetical protein
MANSIPDIEAEQAIRAPSQSPGAGVIHGFSDMLRPITGEGMQGAMLSVLILGLVVWWIFKRKG